MSVRVRLVAYIESHLRGIGDQMYDIHTRQVPEQQVLTIKRHVRQPELLPFLMEWMPGIAAALDKTRVKHQTHTFVIYDGLVNEDSDGPVEVCMAFEGTITVPDGLHVRIEPAHTEAYTTITKAQCEFPRIMEAYDAVQNHIVATGLEFGGSPREVYFVDVNAVGPNDPFVDIAFPIAPVPELVASRPAGKHAE